MKVFVETVVCIVAFIIINCQALPNLLNTSVHTCITCLCHARTGCWSLQNCASYSISYNYWIQAGAPTVSNDVDIDEASYKECIMNDNCVINTIVKYVQLFDERDCVCDGLYDCRDMLSLHLYGDNCVPIMGPAYEHRYNSCARLKNLQLLDPRIECVNVDI